MSVLDSALKNVIYMPFGDGVQAVLENHKVNCYPDPGKPNHYEIDIINLATQETLDICLGGHYFPILFVPKTRLDAFIAYLVRKGY